MKILVHEVGKCEKCGQGWFACECDLPTEQENEEEKWANEWKGDGEDPTIWPRYPKEK